MEKIQIVSYISNWPAEAPQTQGELLGTTTEAIKAILVNAGYNDEIIELVKNHKKASTQLVKDSKLVQIKDGTDVCKLIEANSLKPKNGVWHVIALNKDKERLRIEHQDGGYAFATLALTSFPTPGELNALYPISSGSFVVVYGGTPDVLNTPGTPEAITDLRTGSRVSDVLFYNKEALTGVSVFSIAAGCGVNAKTRVEFPDLELLALASGKN